MEALTEVLNCVTCLPTTICASASFIKKMLGLQALACRGAPRGRAYASGAERRVLIGRVVRMRGRLGVQRFGAAARRMRRCAAAERRGGDVAQFFSAVVRLRSGVRAEGGRLSG